MSVLASSSAVPSGADMGAGSKEQPAGDSLSSLPHRTSRRPSTARSPQNGCKYTLADGAERRNAGERSGGLRRRRHAICTTTPDPLAHSNARLRARVVQVCGGTVGDVSPFAREQPDCAA